MPMIKEVKLPEISENVETGEVTKVLVSVGDMVAIDDPLLELETEKAVFELPSTAAGRVVEILVNEGDTVNVGQTLVKIDTEGKEAGGKEEKKEGKKPAEEEKAAREKKREGSGEEEEEEPRKPRETRSDQAAEEAAAESEEPEAPAEAREVETTQTTEVREEAGVAGAPPPAASPSVRRLARELGVDIRHVKGTGKAGKISSGDIKQYVKSKVISAGPAPPSARAAAERALPDFSKFGEIERRPMSKVRRITADTMSAAWTSVPHVTQYDEVDITDLEAARKRHAKRAEEAGGKLTMTAILLKACAGAIKKFPEFNTSVDMAAGEIIYKKYINIGVAVDTDRGLLVPVIRNVDCKNIVQLAVELGEISERARNKKITPDQMEGGNFTISNLGGIGGTYFSPIVYAPDVAILGVSRAEMRPRWMGDEFEPRLILPLSLSYDHRIIDGALAVRFTRWLAQALEDPVLLALGG